MALARPAATMMKGALQNDLKKHVIIASVLSVAAALGWKFCVNDVRKAKYQEFYRFLLISKLKKKAFTI